MTTPHPQPQQDSSLFDNERHLLFYRRAFTYTALVWAVWIVPLKLSQPTWDHKVGQRLSMSAFLLFLAGSTYFSKWARRNTELLSLFVSSLFILFQAALAFHNGLTPTRAFTNILLNSVACMMFNTRKFLYWFYVVDTLLWSSCFWLVNPEFDPGIFFFAVCLCNLTYAFSFESKLALTKNLAATEGKLQSILTAFPDVHFVLDKPDRVVRMDAAQTNKTDSLSEHFPPEVSEAIVSNAQKLSNFTLDYNQKLGDSEDAFELRGIPLHQGQTLLVVRNITDVRAAEVQNAKLRNELQHALRFGSVSRMLSGLKVELVPWVERAEKFVQKLVHVKSQETEHIDSYVAEIQMNCDSIARKISILRHFAEEAGSEKSEVVSLSECINESLELVKGRADALGIELVPTSDFAWAKTVFRKIDLTQALLQIVEHVIDSAGVSAKGETLNIEIQDSGAAILLAMRTLSNLPLEVNLESDIFSQNESHLRLRAARDTLRSAGGDLTLTNEKNVFVVSFRKFEIAVAAG